MRSTRVVFKRNLVLAGVTAGLISGLAACAPTVNVKVAPISIHAKLDVDVRIKLDKEVQNAIQSNPNLF